MKKNRIMIIAIILLAVVSAFLGYKLYQEHKSYAVSTENTYNMAFFELVDYTQNVKTYLAKSIISKDSIHGAETLTHVWREANLAQTYLSMLPIGSQELENAEKFLNQVSEYSYSLSRKNINNEDLNEEDLKNLKELYGYSVNLSNVLNQLSEDINSGRINWNDLSENGNTSFAKEVGNISQDSFSNLEENFHEYSGLIYDGAFSEHLVSAEKLGLTGDDIDEDTAENKIREFIGNDKIKEVTRYGISENGDIVAYTFLVKTNKDSIINIAISKKGGHIILMNSNRNVETQILEETEAIQKAREFIESKGYTNMKETYYLKQNGVMTLNYAYEQNGVEMYADLIKVKVALDDGEILGIETTGYLNCHHERNIPTERITIEEAKSKLNTNLEITSEGLAMIPTEWKTEVFCYEFQGKVNDIEFLAYINAETGEEQDILVITNTPNGTLTE
ncbi:MAG: germination protein YpeB [Clostridia bacterium]|nr:germination protein YpeB [Clostridia bacterium]